jgi:hypothetical protein
MRIRRSDRDGRVVKYHSRYSNHRCHKYLSLVLVRLYKVGHEPMSSLREKRLQSTTGMDKTDVQSSQIFMKSSANPIVPHIGEMSASAFRPIITVIVLWELESRISY